MTILAILIFYIFINNWILVKFLGLCPFIGVSKNSENALGMGMALTFVTAITSVLTWAVYHGLLVPFHLEYLETLAFILVIASTVQFVEMVIRKISPPLYKALGIYLPLITTNCVVLGIALINIDQKFNALESFFAGLASGLGFTLAIILMSNIRERLDYKPVPGSFRGMPIAFISAGLMALAFKGFDASMLTNLHLPALS
ncbi:MAG: electron transport complex subunit RsxA [Sphaerochaeta sp.]|jgi:electron transport complex protein RnfA|nr:electron transport complex subunit RsxA [Sphaerochaeta sp.]MCH3920665.1 electron transport complex subunit RsxA [Sphaerochaeta sp.]MCI2045120.1 electron transport complex subunit RsxA [Sphaerochaeta sp.]MCI2076184.1 electron transport complex subunit RsxA [Sphaerochaeta sp.]MCI2096755.1 electron transport complex subunit RsxA [Sphaerochaeta sp.]